MVSKDEREDEDQHMGHVAFRIPDFWPHDPSTWFRKIESKFQICNIKQSSTKYDHLLSALTTDICSSINDSLAEIDENAADARLRAAEGAAYVALHHGPLDQIVRTA